MGQRSLRDDACALALRRSDLPGRGWIRTRQSVAATRTDLPMDPEYTSVFDRAGKAGCLSVRRHFVQLHSKRGVESRVSRFVCASDAQLVVARSSELLAPNPYSPVSVVGEMVPVSIELAGVEAFRAWELRTSGPSGAGASWRTRRTRPARAGRRPV